MSTIRDCKPWMDRGETLLAGDLLLYLTADSYHLRPRDMRLFRVGGFGGTNYSERYIYAVGRRKWWSLDWWISRSVAKDLSHWCESFEEAEQRAYAEYNSRAAELHMAYPELRYEPAIPSANTRHD